MRSRPALSVMAIIGLLAVVAARGAPVQPGDATVKELPIQFPVAGNLDAVRQWQLGRLQEVQMTATDDIVLGIRTSDGSLVRAVGPGAQLSDLAWRSNWVRSPERSFPGRSDWVERMIAFDVDSNGRIIAMASLEPVARDPNRLRRALGTARGPR